MRPRQFTISDSGSSKIIPLDWASNQNAAIVASPNGTTNYSIAYTVDNVLDNSVTPVWIDISDMASATVAVGTNLGLSVAGIKATLNSGSNLQVSVTQAS